MAVSQSKMLEISTQVENEIEDIFALNYEELIWSDFGTYKFDENVLFEKIEEVSFNKVESDEEIPENEIDEVAEWITDLVFMKVFNFYEDSMTEYIEELNTFKKNHLASVGMSWHDFI